MHVFSEFAYMQTIYTWKLILHCGMCVRVCNTHTHTPLKNILQMAVLIRKGCSAKSLVTSMNSELRISLNYLEVL